MKHFYFILLIASVAAKDLIDSPNLIRTRRILGGQDAAIEEVPYQVIIHFFISFLSKE